MAQPVFEEHPLGEYFRHAGENPFTLPGTSFQFDSEMDPYHGAPDSDTDEASIDAAEFCPALFLELFELLRWFFSAWPSQTPSRSFAERFRYRVISSSLLSTSFQSPHAARPSNATSIPGRLQHSRTPSLDVDHISQTSPNAAAVTPPEFSYSALATAVAAVAVLYMNGYPLLGFSALLATTCVVYNTISTREIVKNDMAPTLQTLDDVVAANEDWEAAVRDALSVLENDERLLTRGPSSATRPSPLRVALFSCLQTTQTQCDNIRHLFAALTCPTELSQLSEMYAPPSPMKPVFTTESHTRPFSFPGSRNHPMPTTPENKRSSWNGPYSSLASAGSPTSSINRRKDKHRVYLSEVFQTGRPGTTSAPITPTAFSPTLADLREKPLEEDGTASTSDYSATPSTNFGSAALDLQRRRRSGGLEAFKTPSPRFLGTDLRSPSANRTMFTPTRYTHIQPPRHPLSLASLQHSLQGCMSAKRYACSHLLALRFSEEEEEGYWEDVRSIIALLTSALSDASTRLCAALYESDQQRLSEQNVTPDTSLTISDDEAFQIRMGMVEEERGGAGSLEEEDRGLERDVLPTNAKDGQIRRRSVVGRMAKGGDVDPLSSFAPLPSHLARFAAHVAAISSSLDDARDHLEQVIASLKEDDSEDGASCSTNSVSGTVKSNSFERRTLRRSSSFSKVLSSIPDGEMEDGDEHPAVLAYERLRREVGLALRECERGKEKLMEIVRPAVQPEAPLSEEEEDEGVLSGSDDLPGFGHDASDESDKLDPASPFSDDEEGGKGKVAASSTVMVDDVTSHLLMDSRLPLPGVDEVFEADPTSTTQVGAFGRERSRLSREERIKMAKARRDSGIFGVGSGDKENAGGVSVEKWGPGGEVVQELKDVIWKVGERKRKMTDAMTVAAANANGEERGHSGSATPTGVREPLAPIVEAAVRDGEEEAVLSRVVVETNRKGFGLQLPPPPPSRLFIPVIEEEGDEVVDAPVLAHS